MFGFDAFGCSPLCGAGRRGGVAPDSAVPPPTLEASRELERSRGRQVKAGEYSAYGFRSLLMTSRTIARLGIEALLLEEGDIMSLRWSKLGAWSTVTIATMLWLPCAQSATKVTLRGDDSAPQIEEVTVPTLKADPNLFPVKAIPEQSYVVQPKLRGISQDEILNASAAQMSDVIIVMNYQPPVSPESPSALDAPETRQQNLDWALSENRRSQSRLRDLLTAVGGTVLAEYRVLNAIYVSVPTRALALLQNLAEVFSIEKDQISVSLASAEIDTARTDIYIDSMHYPSPSDSTKGSGQVIAVVDSGMNETHPDLDGTSPGSKVVYHQVFDGSGTFTDDSSPPHGTSVAGIVAGRGVAENNSSRRGIAPAAKLFNLKAEAGDANPIVAAIDGAIGSKIGRDGLTYTASILSCSKQVVTSLSPTSSSGAVYPDGTSPSSLEPVMNLEDGLIVHRV